MDWRKVGKKLFFPPVWVIIVLTVICTAALIYIFLNKLEEAPIAYVAYVLAFYTLSVICIFLWMVLPGRYKEIKKRIYDHPVGNRYMTDMAFRTHISLYASLTVNLLYVGVNVLSYVLYRSMWFVVLAVYYMILSCMRFLLVRYVRKVGIGKDRMGELKSTRVCSTILLTVNFVLSGAVLMILYQNRGFEYHGMFIYVMAMYTFYMTTHAIIDLIKYRKYRSPVMTTAKIIALSAALVSMLSLETAMFSQFGQDMTPENKRMIVALTGAGVSITVVAMSVYMIISANREIKKLRINNSET